MDLNVILLHPLLVLRRTTKGLILYAHMIASSRSALVATQSTMNELDPVVQCVGYCSFTEMNARSGATMTA